MGNGGSKGGGGGGSGSKGNSICGIDRRDIRSITHEYTSDKSKTGTICITSSISKGGVTDCFSTHYRESYPSASSDSRGGEGRVVGNSSSVSNISATSIYGEPINKNTLSITEQRAIKTDFTKILRDLYPQDYSKHIDNWPSTLWGKQVLERGDFEAIEKFFITEFVDILHKRYPNDYPADFKDWNSKNSQWGKEVILTKNFKAIGKWLPAYKKEVLEQQTVLKNDFIEILHRVYPEDYPMTLKDWNNIWGKEVLERGDFEAIKKHLPSYEKQALEKEQNILFLVKDKSDVYLGGMSIGDYGVKLIIGNIANKITTLNLANNQIRDDGAKLLANSLAKGEMPNLKKLHLEGNNITDEGVSYYLDNLKKDQLNSTYVSFTAPKSTIDKIMEFFGKGARYYVNEFHKNQQSSKEADIAVNGKDGFGHCVQVVRTAGIDFASAMAQKAIAAPPIVKKAMKEGHPLVKLIVGGTLVKSAFDDMKGAFLSEDFAHCMAFLNKPHDEEYDVGLLGQ